jgi:cytochrome c-type biogenesis protein CcmH
MRGTGLAYWWLATLAATATLAAIALGCTSAEEVPAVERRARQINEGIMCPVCPGESIDQSQHTLAVQMRAIVTEKLEQGWTGDQINAFFVERYGPMVLLQPPTEGFNLLVWVVPPAALALAAAALFLVLRQMVRSRDPDRSGAVDGIQLSEEETGAYFRRIEAALAQETGKGERVAEEMGAGSEERS